MAALQYVHVPGYSAGIFRRTKEDLNKPDAPLARAHEWFRSNPRCHWDEKMHGYRFPTIAGKPDATIHFGYATDRQSVEDRYQGVTFQFIAPDEVGQWLESVYRYLFSRLRTTVDVPVPLRMRPTGNPGGRGGEWVRARFVEFAKHASGETVKEYVARRKRGDPSLEDPPYFESPPTSEALEIAKRFNRKPQGAFFIPAFATDNPSLKLEDYMVQLAKLDPLTRQQLEHGDWWVVPGGAFFEPDFFEMHDAAPPGVFWIRSWDLAATEVKKGKDPDWTAGVKVGLKLLPTGEKQLWISDARRTRRDPGGVQQFIRATAETDTKRVPIYIEQEPGSAGKNNTHTYATQVLFGWNVTGYPKTGPKPEYWGPVSSVGRNAKIHMVRGPWNEEVVSELCALTQDDSHAHDDYADAIGTAYAVLTTPDGLLRVQMMASRGV